MRKSPCQFSGIGASSPLLWLARGYAVLDGPTMPIVAQARAMTWSRTTPMWRSWSPAPGPLWRYFFGFCMAPQSAISPCVRMLAAAHAMPAPVTFP